ncbi:hypothetical protein Nepgr_015368 [Nepenthes gracilis]|uniref:Uncharacterized protein n=1 Tax=Nepenthes gracilis TaxID=150966 RepID=A0AAD3XQC1_NEPGR|nr:hypothetical protein Nepgr_015368 [Nepenthes gracilis]
MGIVETLPLIYASCSLSCAWDFNALRSASEMVSGSFEQGAAPSSITVLRPRVFTLIINPNQLAFISDKNIRDKILLVQEFIKGNHLSKRPI